VDAGRIGRRWPSKQVIVHTNNPRYCDALPRSIHYLENSAIVCVVFLLSTALCARQQKVNNVPLKATSNAVPDKFTMWGCCKIVAGPWGYRTQQHMSQFSGGTSKEPLQPQIPKIPKCLSTLWVVRALAVQYNFTMQGQTCVFRCQATHDTPESELPYLGRTLFESSIGKHFPLVGK
jgi:hypothetical protein